ncbi:amidohydrolase [Vibrio sp. 10N.261.55.A7]|uniref:amidohydrolase n=1 Tax=Vibrio sp. 10N.261.55.A7 TaxID=1880851 RepID=UPI000C85F116|nr:amidohydrolase [Vibrio sp. 10N.261.55.A7]PMK02152.1 hypothetical protein BCU12_18640 [Vibrio sp. 10N.261.55.A7]
MNFKKVFLSASVVLGLAAITGCNSTTTSAPSAKSTLSADYIFTNAKVYTVNEKQPWAEAVVVDDNKIVYVGDAQGAKAYSSDNIVDLAGKMILPGFVSGHDHLVASNWTKAGVNLFPAKSKQEYLSLIKAHAEANPDDEFLYGYGWNYTTYGGRPTAAELDSVAPNHKAIIFDFTIHDAWLNSKMMAAGNINKDTEDKQPGFSYWERDAAGNPTGNAIELSWFPAYISSGAWDRETLVTESQSTLYNNAASQGWTSVVNLGLVTPNISNAEKNIAEYDYAMKLLAELEKQDKLKLRTFMHWIYKNGDASVDELVKITLDYRKKYNSDMLRMSGIKIHPEANWGTQTSLLLEGYSDKPEYKGIRGISAERVEEVYMKANAQGIDVSIHADGSATVRASIDSIIKSRKAGYDARNSLQHFAVVHPDDMKRVAEYKIPVNLTPIWRTDWGNTFELAQEKLGDKRSHEYYQMLGAAVRTGTTVSISADVPSTPSEEAGGLFLLESAMTQMNPNDPNSVPWGPNSEALTLAQGLKTLTIDPAWQTRMETKVGSLEVGKYADLVILEKNLFDVKKTDIADVKVLATMMNGSFTYKNGL